MNIADVANAAGVGTGTVSRVLNDSDSVRPATRARVLEVIADLDYRPSRLASGLSKGTPRTVAIVVPYLTRPSVVERLAGAISVLDEHGYDTVVFNVETAEQRDRHLESLTARHRADGVIIVSIPLTKDHLAAFVRSRVPLVLVDTEAAGVPCTIADDIRGGCRAVEHLLALGHVRIGFVGDSGHLGLGFRSTRRRHQGYRLALTHAHIAYDPSLVRQGEHGALVASLLAEQLLRARDTPTAIFAASDSQAIGVLSAADRLGIAVPAQLSVIGYDDIETAALLGLTTVRQPLERSGALGAQRLCALLRREVVRPLRQELPVEVVPRTSTAVRSTRRRSRSVGAAPTREEGKVRPRRVSPSPGNDLDAAWV